MTDTELKPAADTTPATETVRHEFSIDAGSLTLPTALAMLAGELSRVAQTMGRLDDMRIDLDLTAGTLHFFAYRRQAG